MILIYRVVFNEFCANNTGHICSCFASFVSSFFGVVTLVDNIDIICAPVLISAPIPSLNHGYPLHLLDSQNE